MNNYEILGLKKEASISEVKSKFRALSKQWHPDMPTGNASKFISIRNAYESILKEDSGESFNYYQQRNPAQYRFEGIKKDSNGYIFNIYVDRVNRIILYNEHYNQIGYYDVNGKEGIIHLKLEFKLAKKANYYIKIVLEDAEGFSATITYKIKPLLNKWQKLIKSIKNLF